MKEEAKGRSNLVADMTAGLTSAIAGIPDALALSQWPFAKIAFLRFIGVVRDHLRELVGAR